MVIYNISNAWFASAFYDGRFVQGKWLFTDTLYYLYDTNVDVIYWRQYYFTA